MITSRLNVQEASRYEKSWVKDDPFLEFDPRDLLHQYSCLVEELTWGEFKDKEVSNNTEISWIDIRGCRDPKIKFYKNESVYIADGSFRDA